MTIIVKIYVIKCLKPKGAKGQKPIHHYMKIKDMLKEEK